MAAVALNKEAYGGGAPGAHHQALLPQRVRRRRQALEEGRAVQERPRRPLQKATQRLAGPVTLAATICYCNMITSAQTSK